LLVAELILLSLRFDTDTLAVRSPTWAGVLRHADYLPRLGIALIVAAAIFGGADLGRKIHTSAGEGPALAPVGWAYLAAHLGALAAFYGLTVELFEGTAGESAWEWAWVGAWALAGAGVVFFGALVVLPPGAWWALGTKALGALLLAFGLGIAAVAFGWLAADLWQPLGRWTLGAVRGILAACTNDVVEYDPDHFRLATSRFWIQVSPECSGYEGMGLMWVFLAFFLWYERHALRFPHAWVLLPLGTAVMWAANVLRITALVAVGNWNQEVALAGFHSQAGWLAFNAVALGTLAAARRWRWLARDPTEPTGGLSVATAAYLAPLFVSLAATMLTRAFTDGFDRLYPLRVVAVLATLWAFRRYYRAGKWEWSWPAAALGGATFLLWIALDAPAPRGSSGASPWSPEADLTAFGALCWLVFRVTGAVFAVPLAEELAFRGYLTRRLVAADFLNVGPGHFTWFAFLVSSAVFGALHGDRWVAGTAAGVLFGAALYLRGRLADAVIAHAVANALLTVYVITTASWWLWA
jgi:exosortase E/protease (VPEID-CTERM system)